MHNARILHTMLRVGDVQRSIDFYTNVLGMRVLRSFDNPENKYSLTFLGYGDEKASCVLELTYNYGVSDYEMGNAYGHIAIGVEDCYKACAAIKERGGKILRDAGPMSGGKSVIAFVADPDGYSIELIQKPTEWLK